MAYDEILADRIRDRLATEPGIDEKKMFGGIAFMCNGNMAVGVSGNELMVRVGKDQHSEATSNPGVRDFDMAGRTMKGWVLVSPETVSDDAGLDDWIHRGLQFAHTLPAK